MDQEILTGKERRHYIRLDVELCVRFRILELSAEKVYESKTCNISHGGVCLDITKDMEELAKLFETKKQMLHLSIELTDSRDPTEVRAKQRWLDSHVDWIKKPTPKEPSLQIGLAFDNLEGEAQERIHGYIVNEFVKSYGRK
jgi:c-di-GMP-binding flagellar brake protein YcgR